MCGRSMTFYVREKTSFDVLYNKQAFLDCENYRFQKTHIICIFPKRLFHGFGQKIEILLTLRKIREGKVFGDVLFRKQAFLDKHKKIQT